MPTRSKILGKLLVETEAVDSQLLALALGPERRHPERIGETLVRLGAIEAEAVVRALALQLGLGVAEAPLEASEPALQAVQEDLARRHGLLPLALDSRSIRIAMSDPLNLTAIDDVQFQTGRRVDPVVTTGQAILAAFGRYYEVADHPATADFDASEAVSELENAQGRLVRVGGPDRVDVDLEREIRRAPVVRLVDRILGDAVEAGASDVHVEESDGGVQVRVRLDGYLRPSLDVPAPVRRAVLSRIKVMAGMDISIRRRAQDGRISYKHRSRRLTLRVSTLPVNGGEKAVVRVLDSASAPRDLGVLGMANVDLVRLRGLLARGEGVILSAGPTGSGKSTTLFAALSELDRESRNVVTLEDPVEYRLAGASQVQVDRRAGLGFPEALRAVLRQDPDVVMVGEIRDRETAEIAMAAAVTGHLVLSTVHTTDAPGAITRLLHMGVPPFLIAGGLCGVVAQRLVRRVCEACRGRGCTSCDRGSAGRTGVYQVLSITDAMRDEITGAGSLARLRRLAAEAGTKSLESDARRAVAEGLTMPHEISHLTASGSADTLPCAECDSGVPLGANACPQCGHRTARRCSCGRPIERGWRYCPWCIRPVAWWPDHGGSSVTRT